MVKSEIKSDNGSISSIYRCKDDRNTSPKKYEEGEVASDFLPQVLLDVVVEGEFLGSIEKKSSLR